MSDWENAPSNDGWEDATWESAGSPAAESKFTEGVKKTGETLKNLPASLLDTAATLGTGAFAGIYGPMVEIAQDLQGAPDKGRAAGAKAAENATWQPRTEMGQVVSEGLSEFMNRVGIPLMGHGPAFVPPGKTPKAVKEPVQLRSVKDQISELKPKVDEAVKPPIPPEAQMELPDSAMAVAPQYGIHEGMGRIDENGMPIRADLSMEAQNLQNPLQRNLWGDELPGKTGDGGLPLTQAIDSMPDTPWIGPRDEAIGQLQHDIPVDPTTASAVGEANFGGLELPLPEKPTSGTGSPIQGMGRSQRGGLTFDFGAEKAAREKIPVGEATEIFPETIPVGEATELNRLPKPNLQVVPSGLNSGIGKHQKGAFLFGGLMFGPDLDTQSKPLCLLDYTTRISIKILYGMLLSLASMHR